ncbi:uncharacterized protein LOC110893327 [Helianthus annuus]|uniref:uncharacterized protein LOC110893327 n=1 Tax=Helianthus annuus TaxID=4232 RepID=UPI000B8FBF60|nr:uncharacterized protein LOC110893327 [Helianthus annuus]
MGPDENGDPTQTGHFSVKQVRMDIEKFEAEDGITNIAYGWNNWATPKANYLLWRAIIGKVASKPGLVRRGVPLPDTLCPRCGLVDEDTDHIFVNCLWSKCIWWSIMSWVRIGFPADISNLYGLISYIKDNLSGRIWRRVVYTIAIATVWWIWNDRNKKAFDDVFVPVTSSVNQIKVDAFLWVCNRSNLKEPKWKNWKVFDILELM